MRIKGQEQIAAVFGVAPKTIVEWQGAGFPVAVRGGPGVPSEYDTDVCIAWYVERELGKVRSESPADRLSRVKADAIEMDNAERRKLLIPAAEIEPRMRAAMVRAREAWCDAPPRLSRQVAGKTPDEVEALLQAEFDGFLLRLSAWQRDDVDEDEAE